MTPSSPSWIGRRTSRIFKKIKEIVMVKIPCETTPTENPTPSVLRKELSLIHTVAARLFSGVLFSLGEASALEELEPEGAPTFGKSIPW